MTVYLVGAGPGDPGLLTVRGHDLLAGADVVLFDGLANARLLDVVPAQALRIDVGKTGGAPAAGGDGTGGRHRDYAARQADINALLVRYGRAGRCVVRLKGGDPFVFGRGGEEALALAAAGVPFEVVPGVSAAVAVPAYAGIPVTHRGLAASFAVVTGHEAPRRGPDGATVETSVDWVHLAGADTLVILMGVGRLPQLVARLLAAGRSPTQPAAVVERGTTPRQRTVVSPLAGLPGAAAAAGVRSPATIVVGEVVRLRERLAWFGEPSGAASEGPPGPPSGGPTSTAGTGVSACG